MAEDACLAQGSPRLVVLLEHTVELISVGSLGEQKKTAGY